MIDFSCGASWMTRTCWHRSIIKVNTLCKQQRQSLMSADRKRKHYEGWDCPELHSEVIVSHNEVRGGYHALTCFDTNYGNITDWNDTSALNSKQLFAPYTDILVQTSFKRWRIYETLQDLTLFLSCKIRLPHSVI